jgi:HEAT repeat protein
VVAHLRLDLEAGGGVAVGQRAEALEALGAVGPEQAVQAHDERRSGRAEVLQRASALPSSSGTTALCAAPTLPAARGAMPKRSGSAGRVIAGGSAVRQRSSDCWACAVGAAAPTVASAAIAMNALVRTTGA